ncbi:MAG: hypothetical protein CR993_01275 [Rhodobacterales bacterium]|nr:MAG: hypothetical protein CR993_01275 [Rhodobacterales bacterium]
MPKLVRLYITQVFVGFGLSALFVGALLWLNIGDLWRLISNSDIGWIAVVMLWVFHGIVFAGVQFAITIMRMGEDKTPPNKGKKVPVATNIPARVHAAAGRKPQK